MKHLTRRQVDFWFAPIRKAIAEMKAGEVDCIDDQPVTRLGNDDEFARVSHCIEGWTGALHRILPDEDLSPMKNLGEKLAADQLLTMEELDAALRLLKNVTKPMMRKPWGEVKEAVNQELMLIALEAAA